MPDRNPASVSTDAPPRPSSGGGPSIAVLSQWRKDTNFLKVPLLYLTSVIDAGGSPLLVSTFDLAADEEIPDGVETTAGFDPYDATSLDEVAGLVIPGGGDIDPEWYGCERHPRTHSVNHRRDRFEKTLLETALERDMPVLAICHGMQLLNVTLGGTLTQHLADKAHLLDHDRDMPRTEPVHKLRVKERTPLEAILQDSIVEVNSHHHQGLDQLGVGLEECAWAEDGVLEAVWSSEHTWVLGVQWHPEAMAPVDGRQQGIFDSFVEAAGDYRIRVKAGTSKVRTA